ncbi:ATP synthase f1 [Colletotrichum asianum]
MANGNTSNAIKSATSSGAIECAVQTEASLQAMVVRINQEGNGLQRVVVFTGWYRNTGGDTEYTLDPPVPGSQEHATRVVIRRVAIAEGALETLMTLPREMLNRLRIKASSHGGGEEGFYDVIKSSVHKPGPAVLYIAKKAVHAVILVIDVELSERFKGAVGAESSATPYN